MTRDEILAMPAGREMDALVAEKVMGWIRKFGIYTTSSESWVDDKNNLMCGVNYWHPSSDISAAWEVVEKLKSQGWSVSVLWDNLNEAPDDIVEYLWHVDLNYYTDDVEDFRNHSATADTAPLAICRAALLAVLS